jgi:hypothetical protein
MTNVERDFLYLLEMAGIRDQNRATTRERKYRRKAKRAHFDCPEHLFSIDDTELRALTVR